MIFFESGKNLFLLSTGISFLIMAVVWVAFARISMARIEKTMVQDGLNRPCPWDGLGGRAVWYAFAVGLPVGPLNPRNDPLIDVPLVREYARPLDRRLGLALVVSSLSFLLIGLSGKFVFGFY
jgi:hypothetical protein